MHHMTGILRNRADDHYPHPPERGKQLEGREILMCWKDATWYEAVVILYSPATKCHTIVYRADDTLETVSLDKCRWVLLPKKTRDHGRPILDGAIIDFKHPSDHINYQAVVYDDSQTGHKLKVAYLAEHSTDVLRGSGWKIVRESPCHLKPCHTEHEIDLVHDVDFEVSSSPPTSSPTPRKRRSKRL